MTADPDAILRQYDAAESPAADGVTPAILWRVLQSVEPEAVAWLWPGRIPLGKLTILDGDPGLGKSTMTLDLAARVTTGRPMPDGAPSELGLVVLATAEDGIADTVRPRFDAAGGDASRLFVLDGVAAGEERPLCLPDDIALLRAELSRRPGVRLIVIDPLMAYLSGFVNSRIDHDVRRTLAPLAQLAAESSAAIVLVRHLNKAAGGSALYRGGGSIGIIGAARAGLLVAADPDDETRRVLANTKSNLAAPAPSLSFRLTSAENGVARVEWLGESAHRADMLVAMPGDPDARHERDEAKDFLRDLLERGAQEANEVRREAEKAGHSWATIRRAALDLRVQKVKRGFGSSGRWAWELPEDAQRPYPANVSTLRDSEHLSAVPTTYETPQVSTLAKMLTPAEDSTLAAPPGAGDAWEPPETTSALTVTALGSGLFLVNGGAEPHEVRLAGAGATCDCADHRFRRHDCKHIVAVRQGVA